MKDILFAAVAVCVALGGFGEDRLKIIAGGWDVGSVTPEKLLAHAGLFDQTPFDGAVFAFKHVKGDDGKDRNYTWGTMSEPITYQSLSGYVPTLKEIVRHRSLRESMIGLSWTPILRRRLEWTDDAAWKRFADNLAVFARICRETGVKAIVADNEDYSKRFQYTLQASDPPYAECAKLARQRGREIGRAIFDENPNQTIYFFWLLSMDRNLVTSLDPQATLAAKGNLWIPLVDGLLDVMPPTAKLVDGDEHGYGYKTEKREFDVAIARHAVAESKLLSPENRAKYRAQTSFSAGHYPDGFLLKPGEAYYNATGNGETKFGTFVKRLRDAARTGDEYLWIWGEHHTYVKWEKLVPAFPFMKIENTTWDEVFPGFYDFLRELKDPRGFIEKRLDAVMAEGKTPNLLAGALVKPNDVWQEKNLHQGTFSMEPGKGHGGTTLLKAEGVGNGCFQLAAGKAEPGERFAASCYVDKAERVYAALRWRKDGKWFEGMREDFEAGAGPADAEGWSRFVVEGRVPEGANGVCFQLVVRQAPDEVVKFDRAFCCRIGEVR